MHEYVLRFEINACATLNIFTFSEKVLIFLHQNDRSVKGHRPMGCATTAAAPEKRRQFEGSKCFDFHNFNAKITLETRGTKCRIFSTSSVTSYDLLNCCCIFGRGHRKRPRPRLRNPWADSP